MFHATRPALVQIKNSQLFLIQIADLITIELFLDATNDDDVSVFPSHSVPDPINGYKLGTQKVITKNVSLSAFVYEINWPFISTICSYRMMVRVVVVNSRA